MSDNRPRILREVSDELQFILGLTGWAVAAGLFALVVAL